jgi:glucose dehydrogenase
MHILKRSGTLRSILIALILAALLAACGGAPSSVQGTCNSSATASATPISPGTPAVSGSSATEWPSPNQNLYNTRVAHSTIASTNVSKLKVAWTYSLQYSGPNGADVANPVIANGIVYLQDGASNVIAVRDESAKVLWIHDYNSIPLQGPNGVTFANGRIYGVTACGVFALDAQTGKQVWYNTHLATGTINFDIAPQVANGKVFVSSALTVGGGMIYALDAATGTRLWSFQTVADKTGQQLKATAGGAWDPMLIGPDNSVYAGIGNPYLSLQEAQATRSRELYTDSIVKLNQTTGQLEWYYQAFPDDFHDWDLQISPIYTTVAGRPVILAAGKGGFVYAFDSASGKLLWKTSVGIHMIVPSIVAAYSIIGEKNNHTLEPVLATPVRSWQFLTGKILSAVLPAMIVTWISGGLFIAELALFTDANVVSHVVTAGWLTLFLAGTPLLGLIAVAVMTAISSRVNDTRTAQQLSVWGIVPVAGLILGELSGQFELTVLVAVIATGILILLAILLTWGAAQLFQRESILTRWK